VVVTVGGGKIAAAAAVADGVGASRRAKTKIVARAAGEEEALALAAPAPVGLTRSRGFEKIVEAASIVMRVGGAGIRIVEGLAEKEALAFVAPKPAGLACARARQRNVSAGAAIFLVHASGCAKTKIGVRAACEEQAKALRTREPVGLAARAVGRIIAASEGVVGASSHANA
jgi:hypothetical protein